MSWRLNEYCPRCGEITEHEVSLSTGHVCLSCVRKKREESISLAHAPQGPIVYCLHCNLNVVSRIYDDTLKCPKCKHPI